MTLARSLFSGVSVPCLMPGLILFAGSPTPSLIPREPVDQGILAGVVTSIGYLAGRILGLVWLAADMPRLSGRLSLTLNALLAVGAIGLSA